MPETNLAERYKQWMEKILLPKMFPSAKEKSTALWANINAQFDRVYADASKNPETSAEHVALRDAFDKLSEKYQLREGDKNNVCGISNTLTWKNLNSATNTKRDLDKRAACQKPTPTKKASTGVTEPTAPPYPTIPLAARPYCFRFHKDSGDFLSFTEDEYKEARKNLCVGNTLHLDDGAKTSISKNGMTLWAAWARNQTGCAERKEFDMTQFCQTWIQDILLDCDQPIAFAEYYGGAFIQAGPEGCVEYYMAKLKGNVQG